MKSNCARWAWGEYLKDPRRAWLCHQATGYSRWVGKIPRPVRLGARVLMHGWVQVFIVLHLIAFERWPHFAIRDDMRGGRDFVPLEVKRRRWWPPHHYEGRVRMVDR